MCQRVPPLAEQQPVFCARWNALVRAVMAA
jgi:hypothetical protein